MKVNAVFGTGVAGKSYVVTRQRRLNCYYERRPDGDKSKIVLYGTPGLKLAATIGTPFSSPFRGMLGTPLGLVAAASNKVYLINSALAVINTGTVNSILTNVQFTSSGNIVMMTDGVNGYYYNGSLLTITAPGFPNGARTCTYVSSYFVVEVPGTQQFQVSGFIDPSTWNTLAFATAGQGQDILVAVDSILSNLILFSSLHLEFWQNVGTTPQPFAPILSATAPWGLAAMWSRAQVAGTLCFLGQSPEGGVSVCQINGYSVSPISDEIDYIINAPGFVVSDAEAMTYRADSHAFYQLTFPTMSRSFLYDTKSGTWGEAQTGITKNYAARHQARFSADVGTTRVLSDYQNSNLYTMDPTVFTDNGSVIEREVITKHALADFNVFSVDEAYLDMEVGGTTLQSGQGSTPQIMIQCSKDNGNVWSTERLGSLGAIGRTQQRVVFRRWGSARNFTFRVRMTDPVKFVITDAASTTGARAQ